MKTARKTSAAERNAVMDEMRGDAPAPSADKLDAIRAKLRELRDIDFEIANLESRRSGLQERKLALINKEVVDVMDAAGVRDMTLEAEGNLPPFSVEVGPYYHANIAADWEPQRREKAFAWISKYHGGMLRNTFTVDFGKNTRKAQRELEAWLKKRKIRFANEFGVPWNTLTSFVREQIEEYEKTPPLDLLGATVGRVAKIKKQKEK
jgi:hypothetical protein